MQIKAEERSLLELFSNTNKFTVPDYQRNYAWKADQIDAFLDDLKGLTSDPDDQHFFGPVVLLDGGKEGLSIIDGQQRLTTTVMLLCILRDTLASFSNDIVTIAGTQIGLSTNYIIQMLKMDDFVTDRYTANRQIRSIFKSHILAAPGAPNRRAITPRGVGMSDQEKAASSELRSAYRRIDKFVTDFLKANAGDEQAMKEQILQLLNAMRSRYRVLEIRMFSEDDAYILFETLNERGLRLTPSDLLKSFTLRHARLDSEADVDDVLAKWDNAVALLGDFPFTKFLRHYLLSRQPKKVQARKIFKIFTKIVDDYGVHGAAQNLSEVEEAAGIYSCLIGDINKFEDSQTNQSISRINMFSDTHRVFLLRVMGSTADKIAKRRATRLTEILAFRWILTGGNAQELESHYQVAANMMTANGDGNLDSACDYLLKNLPSDQSVESAFMDGSAKGELQFYVLNRLNFGVTGTELPHSPKQVHVEHLAPQRPNLQSNWFENIAPRNSANPNDPTYEDFVSRWGNLTLLEFEINTSISNSEWNIKVEGQPQHTHKGLQDSNIQLTRDVSQVTTWTASSIDARTAWMARAMVDLTSPSVINGTNPVIPSFSYNS
jgi:hypothetical protein